MAAQNPTLVAMQTAIDTGDAVCVLNPNADVKMLAGAAQSRAWHLESMIGTFSCLASEPEVSINMAEVAGLFAPTIADLKTVCDALVDKLREQSQATAD